MWNTVRMFLCFLTIKNGIVFSLTCYETPFEIPAAEVKPKIKEYFLEEDPVCFTLINYTIPDGRSLIITKNCKERGDCALTMEFEELEKKASADFKGKKRTTALDCIECDTDKCNVDNKVDPSRISTSTNNTSKYVSLYLTALFIVLFFNSKLW